MTVPVTRRQFLGAASIATLGLGSASGQKELLPKPTRWPQDRRSAVSLTFDDAMRSQLDNARPILKKHGIRGTFFVITGPGSSWLKRARDWRQLAAEGNEIGSHTVNHPCLLERNFNSQKYSREMMLREVRESSRAIIARVGARRGLTFAYPCGDMTFGPPAQQSLNQALYLSDVAEYFFAARAYNSWAPVVPEALNPLTVPVLGWTEGKDSRQLLARMEPLSQRHTWGVYTFHGVGGQWLSVSKETLEEVASYLERHPEIWTAPFGDVVRYIQESKALGIRMVESASQHFQFSLNWPMDPTIYDLPLTLQWTLPSSWNSCRAYADGKPVTSSKLMRPGGVTALVDIRPRTEALEFRA
ncbi:MAG TPA: polysaccharide deacetylase family protein, partial [Terriglobia bacterium]|nr:polysaccharide deacetylase family protein [Terriglobia bacterium]